MKTQKLALIGLISWLWGCQGGTSPITSNTSNPANCPPPPASPTPIALKNEGDFYDSLQSRQILADADTITFQSVKYNFVFCRGNNTWTVQPGTWRSPKDDPQDYEGAMAKLANPPYQSVELDGKIYQYRVLLDPNPFPNWEVEPQQVVWELIVPGQSQPQQQVLYTLAQVKEKQTGIQLGVAEVTGTVANKNEIFWTIAPEQGEGNGGIATIVHYRTEAEKIDIIQPSGLEKQQFTDLAITGEGEELTLWLTAKQSGEGNPYLPGFGLVAYRPNRENFRAYHVRNSPLIGAIPNRLKQEEEWLWVATGNGICRLQWQQADDFKGWNCWRFALISPMPTEPLPIYPSLFSQETNANLAPREEVEVLWWSPTSNEPLSGRYEIRYEQGFTGEIEVGMTPWNEYYPNYSPQPWQSPFFWVGRDWHWGGDRFVRPFDAVSLNRFGGGPNGIGSGEIRNRTRPEAKAIRGDLDLLSLTDMTTEVKYYSAWVDDNSLAPYLSIMSQESPETILPNPLEKMNKQ